MCVRYNPPQSMILRTRLMAMVVLAILLPSARAADWGLPAAALARSIAAITGPGQVQLTLVNRSSLHASDVAVIGSLLKSDLHTLAVKEGSAAGATEITVTLSQNVRGGLWVVEVKDGADERVVMLPVRMAKVAFAPVNGDISLEHTTVIREPQPVLDAQVIAAGSGKVLVVLESRQILVYEQSGVSQSFNNVTESVAGTGLWTLTQAFTIPGPQKFPRDVRGRVVAGQQHLFDAFLPGLICKGTYAGTGISITCADSDDPWPVTPTEKAFYDSSRDYFMGVLAPGFHTQLAPFYEAAEIPRTGGPEFLLNNVNGTATLIDAGVSQPMSGTEEWGSDLAAIPSACGDGALVVVSGAGPADAGDSLRAFEISGRDAIPASAPMEVDGMVTAIWPSQTGNGATVVVRRAGNAGYEVWSVAANCH